jgi:hypothetical protein
MSQDQITIYPQHPSNIISGTYINSNIIVHNPAVTIAKKQTKVKLTHPDQRPQNYSIYLKNEKLQANLAASHANLSLKSKKNGTK